MSQHKDEQNKKPDVKDLDTKKDPKAGGGFKPASGGGGGGTSPQPVPPPN
jgi:hypothetical protein